jgi:hypothetical protein
MVFWLILAEEYSNEMAQPFMNDVGDEALWLLLNWILFPTIEGAAWDEHQIPTLQLSMRLLRTTGDELAYAQMPVPAFLMVKPSSTQLVSLGELKTKAIVVAIR